MRPPAIELTGVGKRYWKIEERSLVRSLVPLGPPNRTELWALRDANLRVEPGETLGIIGRNGAGKSTMLRLLAGVTGPTTGTVVTRGRVAPLLSVGVGFHH
jgi:ABC-type polysaccharide/polyol phosphate transport system ATPase subunit